MILYIASEMASQFFAVDKFVIAKKFFDRIAKSYRKEGWWTLLSSILNTSLVCAIKLGLINDFIEYSLELLTPEMSNSLEEKKNIQNSIVDLLDEKKPEIGKLEKMVNVPMEYNHPLFGVGIQFSKSWVYAKSSLQLLVKFVSHFPANIRFSKVSICFANSEHNREIVDSKDLRNVDADSNNETSLLFVPNKPKFFTFEYISQYKSELKCVGVELELGSGNSCIKLVWNVNEWPEFDATQQIMEGKKSFY